MGGLAFRAPVLAALFLIVALATLAMPGSANFVGEFLILTGTLKAKIVYAFVAGAGVVLAAVYMIRLYQRSMHNPLARAPSRAGHHRRPTPRARADRGGDPVPRALPAVHPASHRASVDASVRAPALVGHQQPADAARR